MILGSSAATAAPAGPDVFGLGVSSCSKWSEFEKAGDEERMSNSYWLSGFLSGINLAMTAAGKGNATEGVSLESAQGWVSGFCVSNPNSKVWEAATSFVVERKKP